MAVGAPWNADWRGLNPSHYWRDITRDSPNQEVGSPPSSNTNWSPYTGAAPAYSLIPGYSARDDVQTTGRGHMRDSSRNPFPGSGQYDSPPWVAPLMYPPAFPGVTRGGQIPATYSPRMVFRAPPYFGQQTVPIVAIGY